MLCDRYCDSTFVYQCCGRGIDVGVVKPIIDYVTDGVVPDLTIILDVPVEVGLERAKRTNKEYIGGDRMEQEQVEFYERLRQGFLDLAKNRARCYMVVDALNSINEVFGRIKLSVMSLTLLQQVR